MELPQVSLLFIIIAGTVVLGVVVVLAAAVIRWRQSGRRRAEEDALRSRLRATGRASLPESRADQATDRDAVAARPQPRSRVSDVNQSMDPSRAPVQEQAERIGRGRAGTPASVSPPVSAPESSPVAEAPSVVTLQASLAELQARLASIETHVGLAGVEASTMWERLSRRRRSEPRVPVPANMTPVGAKLLAVVNHWWSLPARDRSDLDGMSLALGLQASFYDTPDLSREMGDVTKRETTLVRAERGGWFCVESDPGTLLAVPTDVMYFRSDVAFAHIARLFERIGTYEEPLGFERVFRPCLLRSAGGQGNAYRIPGGDNERGLLVLRGGDLPKTPGPPRFDDWFDDREAPNEPVPLLRPLQSRLDGAISEFRAQRGRTTRGDSEPPSKELDKQRQAVTAFGANLESLAREVKGLRGELAAGRGTAEELQRQVADLRREVATLQRQSAPAPSPSPLPSRLPASVPPSAPALVLPAAPISVPLRTPSEVVPPRRSMPGPAQAPPPAPVVPRQTAEAPAARVAADRAPADPGSDRPGRGIVDRTVQGLLQSARDRMGSAGEDQSYPALLASSVRALKPVLSRTDGGWSVEIVHVLLAQRGQSTTLQIHRGVQSAADRPDELTCAECGAAEVFSGAYASQFFILAESADGSDAGLAVPLGPFMASSYLKGYNHLVVQSADEGTVSSVEQCAWLKRQPAGDYVVLSKMQLVIGGSER